MNDQMLNTELKNKTGNLEYLSQKDAVKMKLVFKASIEEQLKSVVTKDMSERYVQSIRKYIISKMLNRVKPSIHDLKRLIQKSEKEIQNKTKAESEPLFDQNQRIFIKEASKSRYQKQGHGLLGTGNRRLYFPLIAEGEKSKTEERVEEYLSKKGYFIRDYKTGYATDAEGKQDYKIGKLIRGDSGLSVDFMKDETRVSSEQYLVLSDYANDIAYMSTRRGWSTCMSYDGVYKDKIYNDIKGGTLVAYLISKNDPYIFNPLARILLKPLRNAKGSAIYYANESYGLSHDVFQETSNMLAKQISSNEYGIYKLPKNIYNDGAPSLKVDLPENLDTEMFLDLMGVEYIKKPSGVLIVEGDLNIVDLGFKKLPDLTSVIVNGDFYCSFNKLKNLEGSPQKVKGHFFCSSNELTSLLGATKEVGGHFDCSSNKLITLFGAPQEIGGAFTCNSNQLTSLLHGPKKVGSQYNCRYNNLTSLEGVPSNIQGGFCCEYNKLTSLTGAPQKVEGDFDCDNNDLTTLFGAPKSVGGKFYCQDNSTLTSLFGVPHVFTRLWTDLGAEKYENYSEIPKHYLENKTLPTPRKSGYGI